MFWPEMFLDVDVAGYHGCAGPLRPCVGQREVLDLRHRFVGEDTAAVAHAQVDARGSDEDLQHVPLDSGQEVCCRDHGVTVEAGDQQLAGPEPYRHLAQVCLCLPFPASGMRESAPVG